MVLLNCLSGYPIYKDIIELLFIKKKQYLITLRIGMQTPFLILISSQGYMRQDIWMKIIFFTFLFDVDCFILWHA